ncbi:MAG: hypothetical protein Q8L07_04100 [Sediminibacterium sp.]|nr:hypothetical protein [Sediminibacterium sp.]
MYNLDLHNGLLRVGFLILITYLSALSPLLLFSAVKESLTIEQVRIFREFYHRREQEKRRYNAE